MARGRLDYLIKEASGNCPLNCGWTDCHRKWKWAYDQQWWAAGCSTMPLVRLYANVLGRAESSLTLPLESLSANRSALGQQTLGTLQEQTFEQGKQLVVIDQCAHEWLSLYFRSIQVRLCLSSKTTLRRKRAAGQILHEALVFHILCHTNRRPRNGAEPWDKLQGSADPFDSSTFWHDKESLSHWGEAKQLSTVPLRLDSWIQWAVQPMHEALALQPSVRPGDGSHEKLVGNFLLSMVSPSETSSLYACIVQHVSRRTILHLDYFGVLPWAPKHTKALFRRPRWRFPWYSICMSFLAPKIFNTEDINKKSMMSMPVEGIDPAFGTFEVSICFESF